VNKGPGAEHAGSQSELNASCLVDLGVFHLADEWLCFAGTRLDNIGQHFMLKR